MTTAMETVSSDTSQQFSSNNPYKPQGGILRKSQGAVVDTKKEHPRSLDSEKQVVSNTTQEHPRSLDSEKQAVSNTTQEHPRSLDSEKQAVSNTTQEHPRSLDSEKQVVSNATQEHPRSLDSEKQVVSNATQEHPRSLDSEKQVVSSEQLQNDANSPMVVDMEAPLKAQPKPVREAGKEVISSWQTKSREESAPIPVYDERAQAFHGELLNDIKGEPPSYDSLNRQSRAGTDEPAVTPTTIEPDSPGANLPLRPEDSSTVGRLLAWMPPPPSKAASQMPPLLQPVIIPQLDLPPKGESVPFARCYSDFLSSHGIPMREFTSFLDGLALAQSPNSGLQGLKMFGAGVAALPLPIIPLAGKGISALATSGSGHSGSRARLYLERAKKEYFAPRGLRLSIIKDFDLNPRLQIPTHAHRLAPLTNSTLNENLSRRRLEGLAPYVAPLRYDVPEQDKQIQGVHKMARKHLEGKFKGQSKDLNRMREQQWHNITHNGLENRGWDQRYKAKMAEVRSLQLDMIREQSASGAMSGTFREMMQALDQLQKELQLLVSERQMAMQNATDGNRGVEAEMREIDMSRGLKWIVIENLQ